MGASLHVKGVSNQDYVDNPLEFKSKYGAEPSIDVTVLRDSDDVPRHVQKVLLDDVIRRDTALLVADSLELGIRMEILSGYERRRAWKLVWWLRTWAETHGCSIKGIH